VTPGRRGKARAIVWTARAVRDLEDIRTYIEQDDPAAADRWIARLVERVERAAPFPFAGRAVPEVHREEVREVLERSYRIVYLVRERTIDVLTVFEGHRLFPHGTVPTDDPP